MCQVCLAAVTGCVSFAVGLTGIDERTTITVGCAFALGGIIFWTGRKVQKVEDALKILRIGQKAILDRVKHLPCERGLGKLPDICDPSHDENGEGTDFTNL